MARPSNDRTKKIEIRVSDAEKARAAADQKQAGFRDVSEYGRHLFFGKAPLTAGKGMTRQDLRACLVDVTRSREAVERGDKVHTIYHLEAIAYRIQAALRDETLNPKTDD